MPVKSTWVIGESVSAAAMNAVGTQVNSTAAKTFYVNDFGADPTGATFSDTAVAAAATALGSSAGTIEFGPGIYKLASTTITLGPYQSVVGNSVGATVIKYTGTGDCIRARDTRAWIDPPGWLPGATGGAGFGGIIARLSIDGTGAGASAHGIHIGDLFGAVIDDVAVFNFTGTSAIGIWFDNHVTWTEATKASAIVQNCTSGVVFDGTANGGYVSFMYSTYKFRINCYANQNGVVLRGNSYISSSVLEIRGNFWALSGTNTGTVLTVGPSTDTSVIDKSQLNINVECTGTAGWVGHKTIAVGASAFLQHCNGSLTFRNDTVSGVTFQNGSALGGRTTFAGVVDVDGDLGRMSELQASRVLGGMTGTKGFIGPTGDWYPAGGNWFLTQMTAGAQTVTVNGASSLAGQAATYELLIQQPASGSTTLTWPGSFVWPAGTPVLSTVNNAVDHIRVTTTDHATFYAQHVNNAADVRTLTNTRIAPRIATIASSATPAINVDTTDQFTITALAAPITSMTSSLTGTPTDGQRLRIRFKDNATAQAIAWGAKFVAGPAALLTTTVISKTHLTEFVYDSTAAVWACVLNHTAGY